MRVSIKIATAVIGGLMFVAAYTPAFAGGASAPSATAPTVAAAPDHSLLGVLSPMLADTVQHKAQKNCKPDTLYSQHSVVGDPDACFQSGVDVRVGTGVTSVAPVL